MELALSQMLWQFCDVKLNLGLSCGDVSKLNRGTRAQSALSPNRHTSTHRGFHYQVSSLAAAEMRALRIWILSVFFSRHGRDAQSKPRKRLLHLKQASSAAWGDLVRLALKLSCVPDKKESTKQQHSAAKLERRKTALKRDQRSQL